MRMGKWTLQLLRRGMAVHNMSVNHIRSILWASRGDFGTYGKVNQLMFTHAVLLEQSLLTRKLEEDHAVNVIKLFHAKTQLSIKLIIPINMPSESLKQEVFFIFQHLSFFDMSS